MSRRAASAEPAFGSDSFLDVTANLVGVLIILIVLVGLRVAKAPPRSAEIDAEFEHRLSNLQRGIGELSLLGLELERQLHSTEQGLSAKTAALAGIVSKDGPAAESIRAISQEIEAEHGDLEAQDNELAEVRSRLVSLGRQFDQQQAGAVPTRKLIHQTPLSRPVESEEIHLELQSGRVTFVDLMGLMERAKANWKTMDGELRGRGRATSEVGPVGPYRLRFTMAREDMPFTQSLLYGSGSFRARLVDWHIIPIQDPRGEPLDTALGPNSQIDAVLSRYSPNKFAVTIWTYPDSFSTFRQLRDQLIDRGYTVAARPLPHGVPIRGSVQGSRSFAQ